MGLREDLKKGIDNVADATDEAVHRGAAEAERSNRELAGDDMTLGDKAKSVANEGKDRVVADVDRVKRDIRSNT